MSTLTPRMARDNSRFPFDAYFHHPSVPFVFIAIPKVGCSAIKKWLIEFAFPELVGSPDLRPHKFAEQHLALSHLPEPERASILQNTPALAFVRDPLDRLRSAFIDKLVRHPTANLFEPARELLEDLARDRGVSVQHDATQSANLAGQLLTLPRSTAVDYDRRCTFREFVNYVCSAEESHLDPHWRPQSAFLRQAPSAAIAPLETLTRTLNDYAATHNRPEVRADWLNVMPRIPAKRGSLANTPAGDLYALGLRPTLDELTDPDLLHLVKNRFAADYTLLQTATGATPPTQSRLDQLIISRPVIASATH